MKESNTPPEPRGLVRWLARRIVQRYYPLVEITNAERIPQSGPVLLCANHGNSLIDAVMIGIAARRPVRFMAKAPLFDIPVLGRLMKAVGMIPAFRGSDDSKQVRRNLESLDIGANVLIERKAMGIFPEGKSTDQAHLEMVRSGAARMAIQAVEAGADDLLIVPIGLTYEHKDKFRSAVLARVGDPIRVREALENHDGHGGKARRALTGELESRLQEVVVHLKQPEWEPWLDDLEKILPPSKSAPQTPARRLWQRKRIADAMNHFLERDPERAEQIAEEIQEYRETTQAAGLDVDSVLLTHSRGQAALILLWRFLCLVLWAVPALAGILFHIIPFILVRRIAAKLDQPGRKTISSNRLLVGVPLYLVWYAVAAAVLFFYQPWAATFLLIVPYLGLSALHFCRQAGLTTTLLRQWSRTLGNRKTLDGLQSRLSSLRERLEKLSRDYSTETNRKNSRA